MDRDGYEAKVRELNGKVVPGVTHGDKGLVVEVRAQFSHFIQLVCPL